MSSSFATVAVAWTVVGTHVRRPTGLLDEDPESLTSKTLRLEQVGEIYDDQCTYKSSKTT
jgi:hypothetical protein